MDNKQKRAAVAAILAGLAGLLAGFELIGEKLRLVHILTLFVTGFGSGASFVAALRPGKRLIDKLKKHNGVDSK